MQKTLLDSLGDGKKADHVDGQGHDDLFDEIYWDMVRIIPHKGRSRGHRLGRR